MKRPDVGMRYGFLGSVGLIAFLLLVLGCGDTITVTTAPLTEGIQVNGTGSAFGKPDLALLNLGVSAEAKTVAQARDKAAEAMQSIIDSLLSNGIAEEDMHTQQFTIQPRYDYINGEQILRGYVVTNVLSIKIRDLENVGTVIDDAVAAGGDVTRVNSIQFTIEDPSDLREEARVKAMQDARAKAEVLANEAGVTLGKPISIVESVAAAPPPYYDERALRPGAEVPTPIEPGTLEVKVTVSVTYEIEE